MSIFRPSQQFNPNTISNAGPIHQYYSITVTNNDSVSTAPLQLQYSETRTEPLISNPSNWFFSIIRFTIDTIGLPALIPQIDLSSTTNATPTLFNPSTTIYTITLTYTYTDQETGVATTYCSAATPVPWYPEAINSAVPFNDSSMLTQDNTSTWYYCYSYQYWIYMINQAFTTAYNSLNDVVTDSGLELPSSNPPFMSWNAAEAIAILNCDIGSESSGGYLTLYSNGDTSVRDPNTGINAFDYNQISIFFNSALYNLFNSFPMTRANWGSSVNVLFPSSINSSGDILSSSYTSVPGGNIQIIVNSYGSLNIAQISSSPFSNSTTSYCQVYQEYSTTPAWNPISSIVFTSASIPVVAGNAGSPLIYDGRYNVQASNNAFIIMEITDFASSNADYRGFINYTPSGEYRLIDLQGNDPIKNIDIQAYWKDKFDVSRPLPLLAGGSCTLKCMFRKKIFDLGN